MGERDGVMGPGQRETVFNQFMTQDTTGEREMTEMFIVSVSPEEIKREKEKARVLRKTRWWQQKLAKGECAYCRCRFSIGELTMDHVVPLVRGGKTTKGNVAPVCKECNSKKKYLLPMEWEAYMQGIAEKK
jgi:5-methylcytosine-specific restriction enzyme A